MTRFCPLASQTHNRQDLKRPRRNGGDYVSPEGYESGEDDQARAMEGEYLSEGGGGGGPQSPPLQIQFDHHNATTTTTQHVLSSPSQMVSDRRSHPTGRAPPPFEPHRQQQQQPQQPAFDDMKLGNANPLNDYFANGLNHDFSFTHHHHPYHHQPPSHPHQATPATAT